MIWINEKRNLIRLLALVVFLTAMTGPWMFERLYVPAQYSCDNPTIRLERDFCGSPMSGYRVFTWLASGIFYIALELIKGTFSGRARELLITVLAFLPVLPFFSTFLLILKKDSRKVDTMNAIFWIAGCVFPLLLLVMDWNVQISHLWGLWLYIGLAITVLIFELLVGAEMPARGS